MTKIRRNGMKRPSKVMESRCIKLITQDNSNLNQKDLHRNLK